MNRCIRLLPSKLQELHIFPLFFIFLFHNYYWRAELSKLDIFLIRSHSFQWYECQCIFLKRHFIFKKLSVKIYVGQAMTYIFPFWTDFAEFWQSLFLSINCQIWFDRPRWQTSCLAFDSGSYLTWDFFFLYSSYWSLCRMFKNKSLYQLYFPRLFQFSSFIYNRYLSI